MNKPQLVYLKLEKRLTTHSPLLLRLRTSLPGCDPDLLSMFGANLYAAAITSGLLTSDYAWLHLCRGKNVTAHSLRYCGRRLNYSRYIAALDGLVGLGLALEQRGVTHVGSGTRYSTRIRPTQKFCQLLNIDTAPEGLVDVVHLETVEKKKPLGYIELRDKDDKAVTKPFPNYVKGWQNTVRALNELNTRQVWAYKPSLHSSVNPFLSRQDGRWEPSNVVYHRVFNESWKLGGRWYAPFIPLCRKEERSTITVNGEATVELDFRALHLSMLYSLKDLRIPAEDPYKLPNIDRDLAKDLFLRTLNCKSRKGCNQSAAELFASGNYQDGMELITHFLAAHEPVAQLMTANLGLSLQGLDSAIMAFVAAHFTGRQIPILLIHDSALIAASHEQELHDVMAQAYRAVMQVEDCPLIAKVTPKPKAKAKASRPSPLEMKVVIKRSDGRYGYVWVARDGLRVGA